MGPSRRSSPARVGLAAGTRRSGDGRLKPKTRSGLASPALRRAAGHPDDLYMSRQLTCGCHKWILASSRRNFREES
jgi:hypothetical protein